MKKLLFVATAALCATVFGAIESTNVVGYQTKTTVSGFNFVAPTFKNVSGSAISIQDIKLSGTAVVALGDNIQILDEGGATIGMYSWDDGSVFGSAGWITDTYVLATETIEPGKSVLINTINDGVTITFSGSVSKDNLVTTSVEGFNFVGNATPVSISIQDIKISGDKITALGDNIQILDEGGATVEMYSWDTGIFGEPGWITDTYEPAAKELNPGDGVLVNTINAGVIITVPSAL